MGTSRYVLVFALAAMAVLATSKGKDDEGDKDFMKFLKEHGEKRELKPCSGDTRYKQPVCQHLGFRFCMRLVKDNDEPYIFGDAENSTETDEDVNGDGLDWWEWSTQPQNKDAWLAGIVKTGGNHWCTCALCSAEAVTRFGCDNLDIKCDATDVAFIRYRVEHDHHDVLKPGWECLKKKCGEDYQQGWPIVGQDCKHRGCARLYGAGYEHSLMPEASGHSLAVAACAAALVSFLGGVSFWRRRAAGAAAGCPDPCCWLLMGAGALGAVFMLLPTSAGAVDGEEVDAATE